MPPESIIAWFIVLLLVFTFSYWIVLSLRERRPRAAAVGAIIFGSLAAIWVVAVLLFPAQHTTLDVAFLVPGVTAILVLFTPIGKRSSPVADPTERVDERLIMFARARYEPGDGRYEQFYGENPELKELDDSLRALPGLGRPGSATYDPLNAPVQEALFGWIDKVRDTVDGPVAETAVNLSPVDASTRLKGLALALNAVAAGTTAVKPGHVYSRIGRGSGEWGAGLEPGRYPYALVFAVEMKEEMIAAAPLMPAVTDSSRQYVEAAKIALVIANYIRQLGYPARAHIDGNYRLVLPPLAADAGLGEVGRLTLLITPEYGPRVRLAAVTTTLPLAQDKPISFGVEDFCNKCSKCARNCPPRALPTGEKENLRGTRYWRMDPVACFRYWCRVGTDCSLCVAVCPYSHPQALAHSFVRAACRSNAISRRFFSRADDLFYGRSPRFTRHPEWMLAGLDEKTKNQWR